jgi:solute carrier family 8 (sodium/calcium exchanger)
MVQGEEKLGGGNQTCGEVHLFEFEAGNMFLEFEPDIEVCGGQLLLPIFPGEMIWSRGRHAFIYFLALLFCFLGVAIAADVFMSAIEVITSKVREVTRINPTTGEKATVKLTVWNETVANLTLMALGSSAPEILLATIEFLTSVKQEPKEGGLGPGTIVGSAAFNLLFIIAICVVSIPDNADGSVGSRTIKSFSVFLITAVFSVWAYVWLLIVLVVSTPDEVTPAEACITVGFFPLLVVLCYATEKGYFCSVAKSEEKPTSLVAQIGQAHLTSTTGMGAPHYGNSAASKGDEPRAATSITNGSTEGGGEVPSKRDFVGKNSTSGMLQTTEHYSKITADTPTEQRLELAMDAVESVLAGEKQSRMRYRVGAARMLAGRSKPVVALKQPASKVRKVRSFLRRRSSVAPDKRKTMAGIAGPKLPPPCFVEFQSPKYSILEGAGAITLTVTRTGDALNEAEVGYATKDGSARAGEDYVYTKGVLRFASGVAEQTFEVPIVDDDVFEPDENFFVVLSKLKEGGGDFELGPVHTAMVTIINDDCPGEFGLSQTVYTLEGATVKSTTKPVSPAGPGNTAAVPTIGTGGGQAEVRIVRQNGCDGQIAVRYFSTDGTARAGRDYDRVQGSVLFKHGETIKIVPIRTAASHVYEEDVSFSFELDLPRYPSDGSEYIKGRKQAVVIVTNNPDFEKFIDEVSRLMDAKKESMSLETSSWAAQFVEAMHFDGGPEATNIMRVMHVMTIGWKVRSSDSSSDARHDYRLEGEE